MPLGPWLAAALTYGFVRGIVAILAAFGVTYAVYTGVDALFTNLETFILNTYNGLGGTVAQVGVLINVPQALTVLFSAFSARLTLKTVGGALSRFALKP